MELEVSFGRWIEKRRKALDLTRDELARKTGCSVSALRKIESDERRPSKQLAELLAGALEIPAEQRAAFIRIARGELSIDRLKLPAPLTDISQLQPSQVHIPSLPVPPTPLIGREPELSTLRKMLGAPQCRLITLVGPGGIGKTRLAIEIARELCSDYTHGTAFVQLGNVNSPELILPAIADALGLAFYRATDPKSNLLSHLREKHMLLVVDNLEHLLEGADLFAEIVQSARHIKILCTSREPLNLRNEWIFEVGGLQIPRKGEIEKLEDFSATALFIQAAERAMAGRPLTPEDRQAAVHICTMADGMPLAIELAAAWTRILSCHEIAREIERNLDFLSSSARDMPPRHRSMRAVFDHSWSLLPETEQCVLYGLSVFPSSFTRAAAEEIAGASLEALRSLVAKSLLQCREAGRFQLHELVRQYAAERLREREMEETRTRDRHSAFYLNLIQQGQQSPEYGTYKANQANMATELDNLRPAWDWAVKQHKLDQMQVPARADLHLNWGMVLEFAGHWQEAEVEYRAALELCEQIADRAPAARCYCALGRLYRLRQEYGTALEWLELSRVEWEDSGDQRGLCRTLTETGFVFSQQGNYPAAMKSLEKSLDIARGIRDKSGTAWSLYHLGLVAWYQHDYEKTRGLYEESLGLFHELEDKLGIAWLLNDLGTLAFYQGNLWQARTNFEGSLLIRREIGERQGIAMVLTNLGVADQNLGDHEAAKTSFRESFLLAREISDRPLMARSSNWTGYVEHILGNFAAAGIHYHDSLALYRLMDDKRGIAIPLTNLGHLALDQNDQAGARTAYRESLSLSREVHDTRNIGCILIGISAWLSRDCRIQEAVQLVSAAEKLRITSGFHWEKIEGRLYASTMQTLHSGLKSGEFDAAWAYGQELSLDEAVELATTLACGQGDREITPTNSAWKPDTLTR